MNTDAIIVKTAIEACKDLYDDSTTDGHYQLLVQADAALSRLQEAPARHAIAMREKDTRIEQLTLALNTAVRVAVECAALWDDDTDKANDVRLGKVLLALAGRNPKYRADTDLIHDILKPEPKNASKR